MPLDILIVDDEALARRRLRTLLADCAAPSTGRLEEAGDAVRAMTLLQQHSFDAVLLDIQMPGTDGLALAGVLRAMREPPCVVFVTAHAAHALAAFEMDAVDYLTKPVRQQRLEQALAKVERLRQSAAEARTDDGPDATIVIQDRGRVQRVPVADVVYLKAEQKYITVRTADRTYIFDGVLQDMADRHTAHFLRVHRNALVARGAIRQLERQYDAVEGEGWAVRLHGVPDLIAVSRRQVVAVREALVG